MTKKKHFHLFRYRFNQFLKNQLATFSLSDEDQKIAEFLVGSGSSGYIRQNYWHSWWLAFTMGIYTDLDSIKKF